MKDCARLESFLAGDLSPAEEAKFETHRQQCPACRLEMEVHEQLDEQIRAGWMTIESPVGLAESALQVQTAREVRASSLPHGFRWLVMAASLVGMLAIANWYIGTQGDQSFKTATRESRGESDTSTSTASNVMPVVLVQNEAQSNTLIVMADSPSDQTFTILKAYPTIQLTKSTSTSIGRTQDDQTN